MNVEVISLDDAPKGYAEFDKGVAKKFVINPHNMIPAAKPQAHAKEEAVA